MAIGGVQAQQAPPCWAVARVHDVPELGAQRLSLHRRPCLPSRIVLLVPTRLWTSMLSTSSLGTAAWRSSSNTRAARWLKQHQDEVMAHSCPMQR